MTLTISAMYCSEVGETAQGGVTGGPDDAHVDVAGGLLQLTGLVQAIYVCVSERHDLTPVQARLLCVLLDGPRGMADLAHCFGVEKAALTGLMDRAERRGLARRSSVPGDRRAAAAFHAEVGAELSRLVAPLAPADREHFRAALTEIIAGHGAIAN